MNEAALIVLKEEATHLREAVGRAIRTIYTLFSVVLPIVISAVFLLREKGAASFQTEYLGFGILAGVSIAFTYANTLWLEAMEYLRYMYVVLWPRMYEMVNINDQENFLQYSSRTRPGYSWIPALIFQSTVLLTSLIIAIAMSWPIGKLSCGKLGMLALGFVLFLVAAFSTGIMVHSLGNLKRELDRTNPRLGAGPNVSSGRLKNKLT